MKHKNEDPRALRSKRMFKEAAVRLLIENPEIPKLTVQKISNEAELNRATFYLHFVDVQDLLKHVAYDIFNDLSLEIAPTLHIDDEEEKEQLILYLDYFYKHRKILSVFFSQPRFKKKMHMILKDAIVIQKEKQKLIAIDILAASMLGIITWWLKDGVHFSSEYIAEQIISLNKGQILR